MCLFSKLLIDVSLDLDLGESADSFLDLIVPVERDLLDELPLGLLGELSDSLPVAVLGEVHGSCGEDSIAAGFQSHKHLIEDFVVEVTLRQDTRSSDGIESVVILSGESLRKAKEELLQL